MRPLFTVALCAELPFGLGLAPTRLVNLLGMPVRSRPMPVFRAFRTALLGFSVLLWIGATERQRGDALGRACEPGNLLDRE